MFNSGNCSVPLVASIDGNGNNNGGWGNDGWGLIWIVLIFAIFGWGNGFGGWGNNGGGMGSTAAAYTDSAIQQSIDKGFCQLNYNAATNTRDIIDNANANTRALLDYLCQDKIAALQAENNDLRRAASQDRQSALLTTAMASQTQQIINAVNPAPIPSYQVPNPNVYYGCNSGCNC